VERRLRLSDEEYVHNSLVSLPSNLLHVYTCFECSHPRTYWSAEQRMKRPREKMPPKVTEEEIVLAADRSFSWSDVIHSPARGHKKSCNEKRCCLFQLFRWWKEDGRRDEWCQCEM